MFAIRARTTSSLYRQCSIFEVVNYREVVDQRDTNSIVMLLRNRDGIILTFETLEEASKVAKALTDLCR